MIVTGTLNYLIVKCIENDLLHANGVVNRIVNYLTVNGIGNGIVNGTMNGIAGPTPRRR